MRITTRSVARSTLVAIMTAFIALVLGVTQSLTTAVTAAIGLTATRAIIVPGTGTQHPEDVLNYLPNAVNHYLVPGGDCVGGCEPPIGIEYDAQFWPIPLPGWGGLEGAKWNVSVQSGVEALNDELDDVPANTPTALFGYSQGATVLSLVKGEMVNPVNKTFFFSGNPQRGDGGVFERFAILGTVPILDATFGRPTSTDTCSTDPDDPACATDFALTYDGVVDFPEWILNPVAILNAAAGFEYVHGTYLAPDGDDPPTETPYGYEDGEIEDFIEAASAPGGCTAVHYCQRTGDTIFITLPARYLPLYQPFLDLADATGTSALVIPVVDLVSPFTQTIIETAYTRDDYGKPSPATLLPRFNPFQVASDLVNDIPEGIDMALTPGHTPLPGSPPLPSSTTMRQMDDSTNVLTEKPKLLERKPLTRLSLFAKPNEGVTAAGAGGSDADRPSLRGALGNVHPVRDSVKAVTGAVKKALGKDDDTADSEG